MQELDIIRGFIGRVRRHLLQRRATEAAVLGGVAALGWLLFVLVLSPWLPEAAATTIALWSALLATLLAVGWLLVGRAVARVRSERGLAREIERAEPELRNDLVTALQFSSSEAATETGASEALVRAHLRRTARNTERYRGRLDRLFLRRDLRTPGQLAALLLAVLVLVGASFPRLVALSSMHLLGLDPETVLPGPSEATDEDISRRLLVRDLALELRYPAYTGMRARRVRNTSGGIEALRGTEVRFEGTLAVPASAATVVLENADGTTTERAAEVRGDRVIGSFAALEAGTWRFRLTDQDGNVLDNDVLREVAVLPDLDPVATIEEPRGIIEVTEDEAVTLKITGVDDFGLSEVAVRYSFEGVPDSVERRVVASVDHQATWAGEYTLDLRQIELEPKDVLLVQAEVVDNDEVSRHKSALSAPLMLRVASPEDRHEAVLRQEQELLDALVGLLGDYLENPLLSDEPGQLGDDGGRPDTPASDDAGKLVFDAQRVSQRRVQVLTAMSQVVDRMQADDLMLTRDYDLVRSLYQGLYERHRNAERALERMAMLARNDHLVSAGVIGYARDHRIPQITATERAIIMLEELIATQWLDAAQMTVNQIREIRERLEEKLREYQQTNDPAVKAEILKDLNRLQGRIDELLSRLSRQMQEIPQEHLNVDAGTGEPPSDAMQSMQNLAGSADQIRQMLENGDIEGALKALEDLDAGLQGMLAMTNQATPGGGGNGLSQLDQRASELMDALNDLSSAEAQLEQETGELREAMRQRNTESMQDQLEPFLERQGERLDEMQQRLDAIQDRPLNDRDRAEIAELERAIESSRRVLDLEDVEGLRPLAQRLSSHADDTRRRFMTSRLGYDLDDPARDEYQPSIEDVQSIEDEAEAMRREIDQLLDQARPEPSLDDLQKMQDLAESQQKVRDRAEQLGKEIEAAGEEFPQLEQLAPEMDKATEFMDDASAELRGGDIPRGLEDERQALRSLRTMKQQLQQTVQRQRQKDQNQESNDERVEIPDDDDSPRLFHQDVLDAMKEPGLNGYEDENSLYYKSLVE